VAAGGVIANDDNAPHWWTLADAEGNEIDLAPWVDDTVWEDED
jgi:4a-hydroxytetrahydrobiopterin dehydratase